MGELLLVVKFPHAKVVFQSLLHFNFRKLKSVSLFDVHKTGLILRNGYIGIGHGRGESVGGITAALCHPAETKWHAD